MNRQLIIKQTGILFPKTYLSIETTSSEEREIAQKDSFRNTVDVAGSLLVNVCF
jgi:hypothetical protein